MRLVWIVYVACLVAAPANADPQSRADALKAFTMGVPPSDVFDKYPAKLLDDIDGAWTHIDAGDEPAARIGKYCKYAPWIAKKESGFAFSFSVLDKTGKLQFRLTYTTVGGSRFSPSTDAATLVDALGLKGESMYTVAIRQMQGYLTPVDIYRPTPELLVLASGGRLNVFTRCPPR